jgi:hypothetical protein
LSSANSENLRFLLRFGQVKLVLHYIADSSLFS